MTGEVALVAVEADCLEAAGVAKGLSEVVGSAMARRVGWVTERLGGA